MQLAYCDRIFERYADALDVLEGFSHITVIAFCIFPSVSTMKLEKIEGVLLFVKGTDLFDQTPILDVTPFIQEYIIRRLQNRLVGGFFVQLGKI